MTLFVVWLILAIFGLRFFAMVGRMDREARGETLPADDVKAEPARPIKRQAVVGR